jgi:hypothetical protein
MKRITLILKDVLGADSTASSADVAKLTQYLKGYIDITLDFSGVEHIGEEFARELFESWVKSNPRVTLTVVKACESVECTINQVLKRT